MSRLMAPLVGLLIVSNLLLATVVLVKLPTPAAEPTAWPIAAKIALAQCDADLATAKAKPPLVITKEPK